ncbi:MAG TPA: cupredoxin domain-containing protein [Burkholderiaceae bacterium]|nr:cupredoxin domain-containing protein [Burkholderiaceae bacterium]
MPVPKGRRRPHAAARRRLAGAALASAACALGFVTAGAGAADPKTVEVSIEKYLYKPAELRIRAGTTVRWVNREARTSHSVLWSADKTESPRFFPDEHYERRFDKPGRFEYTCGPHPEMKGVVIVTD